MNLINSILENNIWEASKCVEKYKDRGAVNFREVLKIPLSDRIPAKTKADPKQIHKIIAALLTEFSLSYNLVRPITDEQIIKCAYDLMKSSEEDNLAIEDFVLFFEGAKQGKYGKIYDRLDNQVIFDLFEVYREARYQEYKTIEDEHFTNLDSMGDTRRSAEDSTSIKQLMRDAQKDFLIHKYQ